MSHRHSRDGAAVRGSRPGWHLITVVLAAVLFVYYLVPIGTLLVAAPPGDVLARLGEPAVVHAALTSLLTATASTLVAVGFGVPMAYWLARSDHVLSRVLTPVVVFPLVLPPVVSGMLLVGVFGPGSLGGLTAAAGIPVLRSPVGVVLAQIFVASPFVVLTSKYAFEAVDPELEEAARTLGSGPWETVRRVTLPAAKPGIIAGVTLAFARAIGEFGATMMVAYHPRTLPVQIWVSFSSGGLDAAFPVAIVLFLVSVGALVVLQTVGTRQWWSAR